MLIDTPLPSLSIQRAMADPRSLSPGEVLQLQRSIGNRAAQRLLSANKTSPPRAAPRIQTKLVVGPVGDEYEQEADRVAAAVMNSRPQKTGSPRPAGQKAISKPASSEPTAHRQTEENDSLQRQPDDESDVSRDIEARLTGSKGSGSPLPGETQTFMEPRFGADFSRVRVHTGSDATQMNQQLDTQAFTHGSDIFFDPQQYTPTSPNGQQILAHELTHVVQQGGAPRYTDPHKPAISSLNTGRIQPFGRYWRLIRNYGRKAIRWVRKWGWRVLGWLRRWGVRVVGWVNKWGVRVIGWLKKYGTKVINWLNRAGPQIIAGIKKYGPRVLNWVSKLPGKIITAIIKYGTQIFKWIAANPKESLILALEVALEIAGAVTTGGTSIVARVVKWLATTGLKLKDVVTGVAGKIGNFTNLSALKKLIPIGAIFSVGAMVRNVVLALFGKLPAQQTETPGATEKAPKAKPQKAATGVVGKLLQKVSVVLNLFRKIYGKIKGFIGNLLGKLNLTRFDWFKRFAMFYGRMLKVKQAAGGMVARLTGWISSLKDKILGFLGGVVNKVKTVLAFFANPAKQITKWVTGVVTAGVTYLLNLLITNPPSAVLKVIFKVVRALIAGLAGKSLIDLVLAKVPFAKAIVDKISSVVMSLIGDYIKAPAKAIYDKGKDLFETTAMPVVTQIQDRISGVMANAYGFVDQLTGGLLSRITGKQAEKPATATAGQVVQGKFFSGARPKPSASGQPGDNRQPGQTLIAHGLAYALQQNGSGSTVMPRQHPNPAIPQQTAAAKNIQRSGADAGGELVDNMGYQLEEYSPAAAMELEIKKAGTKTLSVQPALAAGLSDFSGKYAASKDKNRPYKVEWGGLVLLGPLQLIHDFVNRIKVLSEGKVKKSQIRSLFKGEKEIKEIIADFVTGKEQSIVVIHDDVERRFNRWLVSIAARQLATATSAKKETEIKWPMGMLAASRFFRKLQHPEKVFERMEEAGGAKFILKRAKEIGGTPSHAPVLRVCIVHYDAGWVGSGRGQNCRQISLRPHNQVVRLCLGISDGRHPAQRTVERNRWDE